MIRNGIVSRLLLRLRRLLYAYKGQEESPSCRFRAQNGQPRPEAYLQIRKLYDSLRHAYCPCARVFSCESLQSFVLMYPPGIPAPDPGGIDFGRFMVMTDNRYYAGRLRSKLKNGACNRSHSVQASALAGLPAWRIT